MSSPGDFVTHGLRSGTKQAPHPCQRCGSEKWTDVDYSGCSGCREPVECPTNAFGSTVHEFPSARLGTKCYCGQVTWNGGLTDA